MLHYGDECRCLGSKNPAARRYTCCLPVSSSDLSAQGFSSTLAWTMCRVSQAFHIRALAVRGWWSGLQSSGCNRISSDLWRPCKASHAAVKGRSCARSEASPTSATSPVSRPALKPPLHVASAKPTTPTHAPTLCPCERGDFLLGFEALMPSERALTYFVTKTSSLTEFGGGRS